MADPATVAVAAMFGATIGSYLNVVIHRLPPRDEQKATGRRSACPNCGAPIPGRLNLPIVSWLWLRGRARCCGVRISPRYLLVEALTSALFATVVLTAPSDAAPVLWSLSWIAIVTTVLHWYFVANLVANTFIDFEFRILPDRLTYPLMGAGLAGSLLVPHLAGQFESLNRMPELAHSLLASVVGLLTGAGLTWGVRALAQVVFRKEAMGLGDVKLMGGIGAFLGWDGAILSFFVGCVVGAIAGLVRQWFTKDPYLAFGPYLAIGAVVTLFWGDEIESFLTVTWPQWQRENLSSPWLLALFGVVAVFLLLALVRRGRSTT